MARSPSTSSMSRGFCSFFSTARWSHTEASDADLCRVPRTTWRAAWALALQRSQPMKRLLLLAVCSALACTKPMQHAPRVAMSVEDTPDHAAFPKSPDVSREIMGWVVLADGERVLRELAP